MASYNLEIKRGAEKDIRNLLDADRRRIISKITALQENPRPFGCEKLKGEEAFRIRQGNYRIIYTVDDDTHAVTIVKVGHRREVYR